MELQFENISKSYKNKQVLKGISLTMWAGVYGLLGSNGAGKTTMIRILADVLHPTKGSIMYDGKDIHAGVSLAILFVNVALAAMSDTVTQRLGVLVDFGLSNVTLMKEVFGSNKIFPVFGMNVSYPVMVILVLTVVAASAIFGIYFGQKSRTVAK